ncbi:MAG: hypothetical protein P9M01_03350 [Candidatus Kappaea frigidicola]|nr:hypothetical protein [Candidatus Kappaea frigidicola]
MNKKIIIPIIAAFIIVAICSYTVFADDAIKQNRLSILNEMKKNTSVRQESRVYRTEHFNVFTDKESIERYSISNDKKFEAAMLRICYMLEEAYSILQNMTSEEVHGKFDVGIYNPEIYMKQYNSKDPYFTYYNGSQARICVPRESFLDPVSNFEDDIGSIYRIFALMFRYARWGRSMGDNDAYEFSSYFGEVGQATSKWNNTLTDEEKLQIIDEIDINYIFLFKKYPDIFDYKEVNRVYMQCPWCKKKIDVTGKRKASRMKCPQCKKTITVEY